MTFFYNLNKKLDSIREKPELKHGQLNERDMSRAAKGYEKYGKEGMEALAKAGREGKSLDPVRAKYDKYDEGIEDRLKDLDPKNPVNIPAYQRKAAEQGRPVKETGGVPMSAKQKSFAALAEPKDKITFADKIAGAKKEVDEMLGDVAAEAMKKAIGGHGEAMDEAGYSAKAARAGKDIGKPGKQFAKIAKGAAERYGSKERGEKVAGAVLAKLRKPGVEEASDDNAFTAHKRPRVEKPAVGTITHGRKHDVEEIPGGRRVTRRVDPSGISVGADDEAAQSGEKRGRGRPKKAGGPAQERVTANSRKADRTRFQSKKTNESDNESDEIKQAMAMLKKAGYEVSKSADGAEQVDEKAVSKKQQKFMGMVHATQKGEKAPSKEVAKVAKTMKKGDAEDFASTKHKGLPEKKKPEGKKKEKTEEAGGSDTPTASSGFSYGKGIYDSINRELEDMIAESMNISMSMNNDSMHGGASKSLTVTATDEDASKLAQLLKMAGLGGGQGGCGCGSSPCSCGQMDEAYGDTTPTENAPDYPTNTETSNDAMQYSGGLNKPKSTGQTTVPVIASQDERQHSYAEAEEDALHRMMEMAGQPASGMGAQVGDLIDYVSPNGEQPPEEIVYANGVQYDPDTNVISVPNSTSLANTHRDIVAAGWKKAAPGARANPMPSGKSGQGQVVGDTPYQLGEEDELARMMEMAGVKKKAVDEEKTEEGNKFTGNLAKARAAGKAEADLDGDGDMEKVKESIFDLTNQWKAYKG